MPLVDKEAKKQYHKRYMAKYLKDPNNKAKHRARVKSRKKAIREQIDGIKDVPCLDCGGKFPPCCMDFDHVAGGKLFNVSQGILKVSSDALFTEIAKCEIVCANCHRIRTKDRLSK